MKKSSIVLTGAVLLSSFAVAGSVFATEGGTYKSDTTVNFIAGDGPTDPQDPTDPGKEIVPENPGTPAGSSLSIDYASSFQFGEQKISTKDKTYYAKLDNFLNSNNEKIKDVNYVQVTDIRGTMAGWQLSASQEGQFKTAENEELVGAQITIKKAAVVAGVSGNSLDSYKPTTVAGSFALDPSGTSENVVSAAKREGIGTWIYRFGNTLEEGEKAIELSVPGQSVKLAKAYSTKIDWTLATVPENP